MTREEAFDFYRKLLMTGEIRDFWEKVPEEMTEKERGLYYFGDSSYYYNPIEGKLEPVPAKLRRNL